MREIPVKFIPGNDNEISTAKYTYYNLIFKFLWEQFSNYANLFFLITACIQLIPNVSPLSPYATLVPLMFVIAASFVKEMIEDRRRQTFDKSENLKKETYVAKSDLYFVHFNELKSTNRKNLTSGNIVRIEDKDTVPADIIVLCASDPEAYVDTMALDGETNLKCKSSIISKTQMQKIKRLSCQVDDPTPNIEDFQGILKINSKEVPLTPHNFIPRGCTLKNTSYVYGFVVFAGNDTKVILNSKETPIKTSKVMHSTNNYLVVLILLLILLAGISSFIQSQFSSGYTSNDKSSLQEGKDFLTFVILLNNVIPISLIVTVEIVKSALAMFINNDKLMTANVKRSSLVEELGQIEYIFSDKTGTLTQNVMELQRIAIIDKNYSLSNQFGGIVVNKDKHTHFFLLILSACHTVIINKEYQASSPDELALVKGAVLMGYKLLDRTSDTIIVEHHHSRTTLKVLHINEFDSDRKRMSMLCQVDDEFFLLCKGADSVILPLCKQNDHILDQLQVYSNEGLRTLCCCYKQLSKDLAYKWLHDFKNNPTSDLKIKLVEELESKMTLLGCTGIEDKLQEQVCETIELLRNANIKLWVLTGDKLETAINIGFSCKLLTHDMELIVFNFDDEKLFKKNLKTYHSMYKYKKPDLNIKKSFLTKLNNYFIGEEVDQFDYTSQGDPLALVITGASLEFALKHEVQFLRLACLCKTVICCRVSPLQKSQVVALVKKYLNKITLSIGDGANDVSMIQEAHIGIGIMGKEGSQAARTSDISINEFKALQQLLLIHGVWNHHRISKLVLFFFYKNITLYLTQFWFACTNYFSGQSIYESWIVSFYNLLFTAFQPMYIGVFEQIVSHNIIYKYPQLYKSGQLGTFFSPKVYWSYIGNAIFHSATSFFIIYAIFDVDMEYSGNSIGLYMIGVTMYTAILITVNFKAAVIINWWNWIFYVSIFGSVFIWFAFIYSYSALAPSINIGLEIVGVSEILLTNPKFYLVISLIPMVNLFRDIFWKVYKRIFKFEPYHIAQEIQAIELKTPKKSKITKVVDKVKFLQRLKDKKFSTYAFSQGERSTLERLRQGSRGTIDL
eukprot:NODE_445_length_7306_cov_0.516997.p1 type:complete len:1074 gc:universal NODE_445_length_7306_cov_0.516997:4452-1231(-)